MTKSPYQILGVSENATQDEIKKAYRKKAREYHPDLHPNDANAAEKMNEVNEAYDRLMNPEKFVERDRRSQASQQQSAYSPYAQGGQRPGYSSNNGEQQGASGQGSQGSYTNSGPYGWSGDFGFGWDDFFDFSGASAGPIHPEPSATDSAEVRQAIAYINSGNYKQAASVLNAIPSTGRNARWHYLIAIANHGAGNRMLALDQIRKALEMEPNNMDYKRAFNSMKSSGEAYRQETQTRGFTVGNVNPFMLCCGCMLLNSICFPGLYCAPCFV